MRRVVSRLALFFVFVLEVVSVTYVSSAVADNRSNIILILTDDQDITLQSMRAMPKTAKLFAKRGAQFLNAFVTSPLCCPSRASILTGQYAHNHNVSSNLDGDCYTQSWIRGPERQTVGKHLKDAGYRTAYFGKYMNNYRGDVIPPGWDTWMVLQGNSKYYNYTVVRYNSHRDSTYLERHGDNEQDYLPTLMTERAIRHMQIVMTAKQRKPLFMILSYPSPHGSEDAAFKYRDKYMNAKIPRAPNFNNGSYGKHWFMTYNQLLTETEISFADLLYRKRLQTMRSVDDAIYELFLRLWLMNALDNTYVFLTSDHGYHLGQFGVLKGKGKPYEDDIRVPFFAYGPRIPNKKNITGIVLNIDLTPTFIDIAQRPIPAVMDGESILKLLSATQNGTKSQWRTSFLLERFKGVRNQSADLVLNAVGILNISAPALSSNSKEETHREKESVNEVELNDCLERYKVYKEGQDAVKNELRNELGSTRCLNISKHHDCMVNGVWNCETPQCPQNSVEPPSDDCMYLLRETQCYVPELKCVHYNNDVWKSPPLYTGKSFCRCSGSSNDSFWCERRIEENENYLYCIFVTTFEEYYNVEADPYQMKNLAYGDNPALGADRQEVLRQRLHHHANCKGATSCSKAGKPTGGYNG